MPVNFSPTLDLKVPVIFLRQLCLTLIGFKMKLETYFCLLYTLLH